MIGARTIAAAAEVQLAEVTAAEAKEHRQKGRMGAEEYQTSEGTDSRA